jgi:hypothetical protein
MPFEPTLKVGPCYGRSHLLTSRAERARDRRCRLHRHVRPCRPSLTTKQASLGSHVIYTLQKARQYKVISIDNHHNSQSAALGRVSQLSKSELPENATAIEQESTEIEAHNCDLTKPEQIRAVFDKYGKGGIWGVVHIAVSAHLSIFLYLPNTFPSLGLQSCWRVDGNTPDLLRQ